MSRRGGVDSRRRGRPPLTVAGLATLVVVAVSALAPAANPARTSLLFLSYVVCLTLCAVWWLLRVMTPPPIRRDVMADLRVPAPASAAALPPELFWLERLVDGTAIDADRRLPRRLREIAAALLTARRGLRIEAGSADLAARAGLGGDRLLETGGRSRWEPLDPPLEVTELRRVVERLESL